MIKQNIKGFTLIELLIVIGIIAILAAAVIIAINPGQQFQQARNSTRRSHMNAIANAVYGYAVDNDGNYPDCVGAADTTAAPEGTWGGSGTTPDGTDGTGGGSLVSSCFGVDADLTPYMSAAPSDPQDGESYYIRHIDGARIELTTTSTEWDPADNIVQ